MTQKIEWPVCPQVEPKPLGFAPDLRPLDGRYILLEATGSQHLSNLWTANKKDITGQQWTYMWNEPPSEAELGAMLLDREKSRDPWFYSFIRKSDKKALGMGAFMRLDKNSGVIEIGHIWMALPLQKTREATEVIYLMMRHAFVDLKVRRLEWKCDALNAPSRKAALRFGFSFEGIFRQHMIYKGRNRDTAWYAIIDQDWPRIQAAFEAWLDPSNFDAMGQQKTKLQVG